MKPINKAAGLLLQAILDEQAMVGLEEKEQHTDRNGMTWSRGDVGHDLVGEAIAFLSEMGGVGLSRMIELARRTNDARILGFIPQYLAIHDSDSRAIDLLERLALTNERRQADVAGSIGDVGTSAVLVLGQINSSRGRRALRTILGSDISRQKRLTAISFLTHEDSRDFLQKLYYQERGSLRASVVDALASFTDHGTLRIVENAMYSSVPVVSRAAKRSLASMRGEDPVGLQIQLCNRGCEEGIRLKAAVNISRHKQTVGVPLLIELLRSKDPANRSEAARTLRSVTGKSFQTKFHLNIPAANIVGYQRWKQWWSTKRSSGHR